MTCWNFLVWGFFKFIMAKEPNSGNYRHIFSLDDCSEKIYAYNFRWCASSFVSINLKHCSFHLILMSHDFHRFSNIKISNLPKIATFLFIGRYFLEFFMSFLLIRPSKVRISDVSKKFGQKMVYLLTKKPISLWFGRNLANLTEQTARMFWLGLLFCLRWWVRVR